jgi:lysophospholipase L1-like esterase
MQAMNGSGRVAVRLLGCVAALVALAAMALPSVASARTPKVKETYVGLGDSLAFGYSQQLFNENEKNFENPADFEHGYVTDYYNIVNTAKKGKIQLVNDGCPGETTESLIGDNPTLLATINAALGGSIPEPVTGEAPCAYHYADGLPLHHEYGGSKSQLESVIATLGEEAAAGKRVKAITLDIGANDQLHFVARIEKEVEEKITQRVTALAEAEATGQVADKVKEAAEKEVEAYVIEQVIPQAYEETGGEEPAFVEHIAADAAAYAAEHHAELTSKTFEDEAIYQAEHGAELVEEGERLGAEDAAKYVAEHGAELKAEGERKADELIAADAPELDEQIITNVTGIITAIDHAKDLGLGTADFKGKFIFEGTYNAYGNDYGTGELLPGSNALVAALAAAEKSAFAKRPLKACTVDPQLLFNPGTEPEETEHMEEWTNMANFTTFEGKANGPDIHATPLGYEVMAKQIHSTCAF